jgi:N,N-dimethylformamidase
MITEPRLRIPLLQTREMPVTGYVDRLSARGGETLTAYVSLAEPGTCSATLVRVIGGDCNPAGPGMRFENLAHVFDHTFPGVRQPLTAGSYGEVAAGPKLPLGMAITWSALIWFRMKPRRATILAQRGGQVSLGLEVCDDGARATIRSGDDEWVVHLAADLEPLRWTRIWLSIDPAARTVHLGLRQHRRPGAVVTAALPRWFDVPCGGAVSIAAANPPGGTHFNGKIERPGIYCGSTVAVGADLALGMAAIAEWDFSRGIDTQAFPDVGPQACGGILHHLPTRAVTGMQWNGNEHNWRHDPGQYGAIHFHEDDFGGCNWLPSFDFPIPPSLNSGSYAFHLSSSSGEDWIPFYVLPPRGERTADVVFVAPVFTYLAYANCYFANRSEASQARAHAWGGSRYTGANYGSYGRSTYNWHADGSGVCLSSRLRPLLTMRPGLIWEDDPAGSGVRHYPADTHLLGWLEAKGIAFDIVTDEDLDDEGADLIRGYPCVLTGTHPEYHTAGSLNAFQDFVDGGGNLAYLGGNGFYWRIARDRDLIECRRAEGGIRLWAAEPGEYHHQIDGRLGGMWRRSGRHPQALTGIGFSAQGPFVATHYRRAPDAANGPAGWILAGVEDEIIGDYGLAAGGAAGFELDRAEPIHGAPGRVHVIATSQNVPAGIELVPEDMLTESLTVTGAPKGDLVRADMVYVETAAGGGVFAAGSITFCGSLWNGRAFDGPVSMILENVVRRFAGL